MFNNNMRASASERFVEGDLLLKGLEVFSPSAYGGEYDLIAADGSRLYKIQVKTAAHMGDGRRLKVDIRRSSNSAERHYSDDGFDVLAVVHPDTRMVAYIPREKIAARASVNLWVIDRDLIPDNSKYRQYPPHVFDELTDFSLRF